MTEQSIDRARQEFQARNVAAVKNARERIDQFRRQAHESFQRTKKERERIISEVAHTLNVTVNDVQKRHELIRRRLRQEAVKRDVHVRVSRSLGALADFIHLQREESIDEQRMLAAIADPAISGSTADKRRRVSVSELMVSAQRQLIQQSEFINVAAHELRTPIMPILAYAEILESNMPEKSEEVEAIKRNAVRLQRLAENILNVARIDSRTLTLRKETVGLNKFVAEIVAEKRATKGTALTFEPSSEEVFASIDRERISQVVSNLVDNAIKFTSKGEVLISIKRIDADGLIQIQDEGPGIDPEIFPLLFTKFGARSQGGTGLGLFICKGIVEAHGGTINARNNKSRGGAVFEFTLPLVEGSPGTTTTNLAP